MHVGQWARSTEDDHSKVAGFNRRKCYRQVGTISPVLMNDQAVKYAQQYKYLSLAGTVFLIKK